MTQKTTPFKKQMFEVLVEYTETFLLPLLDNRFAEVKTDMAAMKYELKDYTDRKLADQKDYMHKRFNEQSTEIKKISSQVSEIVKRLNKVEHAVA